MVFAKEDHPCHQMFRLAGCGYQDLEAAVGRDGKLLWKKYLGGHVVAGSITYQVDGRQYVAIAAGHALVVFGLRE